MRKKKDEVIAEWLATHENKYFEIPPVETAEEKAERIRACREECQRKNNAGYFRSGIEYNYKIIDK